MVHSTRTLCALKWISLSLFCFAIVCLYYLINLLPTLLIAWGYSAAVSNFLINYSMKIEKEISFNVETTNKKNFIHSNVFVIRALKNNYNPKCFFSHFVPALNYLHSRAPIQIIKPHIVNFGNNSFTQSNQAPVNAN